LTAQEITMARGKKAAAAAGGEGKPLTLTEVSKRTGISMPTLQKYKKRYGDRIPSVGKGRTQRYPAASLVVFTALRKENMARRGRPRKDGSAASPRKGGRRMASRRGRPRNAAAKRGGLLTLTQIQRQTGISYPTLLRYVRTSLARIPHVGIGRARRFQADAVEVFRQLRGESRRGRPPGSKNKRAGARRGRPAATGFVSGQVSKLANLMTELSKRLERVEKELKKPLQIVRR
jgi:DNA-binding transcriptional MerR regulator